MRDIEKRNVYVKITWIIQDIYRHKLNCVISNQTVNVFTTIGEPFRAQHYLNNVGWDHYNMFCKEQQIKGRSFESEKGQYIRRGHYRWHGVDTQMPERPTRKSKHVKHSARKGGDDIN